MEQLKVQQVIFTVQYFSLKVAEQQLWSTLGAVKGCSKCHVNEQWLKFSLKKPDTDENYKTLQIWMDCTK